MRNKNTLSLWLAVASGMLLFISGTNGYNTWKSIQELVSSYFPNNVPLNIIFIIFLYVSSLGGISVIIGGSLIYRKKIFSGRLLVMLGSGAGIIYMAVKIFLILFTEEVAFDLFSSLASIGIVLAIAAQITAKK